MEVVEYIVGYLLIGLIGTGIARRIEESESRKNGDEIDDAYGFVWGVLAWPIALAILVGIGLVMAPTKIITWIASTPSLNPRKGAVKSAELEDVGPAPSPPRPRKSQRTSYEGPY